MSTTSQRTPVTVRIEHQHVQQLREIADRNASTISRTIGRIVAEKLDTNKQTSAK